MGIGVPKTGILFISKPTSISRDKKSLDLNAVRLWICTTFSHFKEALHLVLNGKVN